MRTIFHCDINNCFASIESALDPSLRGRPIAVCGSPEERRGIVLAKSEEAKRCGVATGDPLWRARQKCPDIYFVPPHYDVYRVYSEQLRIYYGQFTPFVEPFGLDECWLDLTDNIRHGADRLDFADKIRADVKRLFHITVSIGVSFNKVFAKLGSDLKKPDAVTEIAPYSFREKIWPLPVSALLDVGHSTASKLRTAGITTIGGLARADAGFIHRFLGKNGSRLRLWANGLDDSPVHEAGWHEPRLSLGHGTTLPRDVCSIRELWPVIASLSERVAFGLQREQIAGTGIQIYVRDALLGFHQYQTEVTKRLETSAQISRYALMLTAQHYPWTYPVHAFGIRIYHLDDRCAPVQRSLFDPVIPDRRRITAERTADRVLAEIRAKYGKAALIRGFQIDMPAIQPSAFPSVVRTMPHIPPSSSS